MASTLGTVAYTGSAKNISTMQPLERISRPKFYTDSFDAADYEQSPAFQHRYYLPSYGERLSLAGGAREENRTNQVRNFDFSSVQTPSVDDQIFSNSIISRRRNSQHEFCRNCQHGLRVAARNMHAPGNSSACMHAGMPSRSLHYQSMTTLSTLGRASASTFFNNGTFPLTPPASVDSVSHASLPRTRSILELRCQQRSRRRAESHHQQHLDKDDSFFFRHQAVGGELNGSGSDVNNDSASCCHCTELDNAASTPLEQDSGGSCASSSCRRVGRRVSQDLVVGFDGSRKASGSTQMLIEGTFANNDACSLDRNAVSDGTNKVAELNEVVFGSDERKYGRIRHRSASSQRRPSGKWRSAYACAVSGEAWHFLFEQPVLANYAEFINRVERDNVCLESIKYNPVYETFRGRVKVKNICYGKDVFLRASYDRWRTYRDFICHYDELSSLAREDRRYDTFSFELPVPSWQIGCFDFCVAFRNADWSNSCVFWDNNGAQNYSAFYKSPDRNNIDAVIERYEAAKLRSSAQREQQSSPYSNLVGGDGLKNEKHGALPFFSVPYEPSSNHYYYQLQRLHLNRYATTPPGVKQ